MNSHLASDLGELERANGWVLWHQYTTYIVPVDTAEAPRSINKAVEMEEARRNGKNNKNYHNGHCAALRGVECEKGMPLTAVKLKD